MKLTPGIAVYPECVSSPVEDDADPNNPETRWFAKGDCASCQHRSAACSLRQGRFDVFGNPSTPSVPAPEESDTEMTEPLASQGSQSSSATLLVSNSRSQQVRLPQGDYHDPAHRERVMADMRRMLSSMEEGHIPVGSPSTISTASSSSFHGFSLPRGGSPIRTPTRGRVASGASRGGLPVGTGIHTRFEDVSPPSRGGGRGDRGRGGRGVRGGSSNRGRK